MPDGTQDAIETLHGMLDRAGSIVAFTGASISTESGVPDFRSAGSSSGRQARKQVPGQPPVNPVSCDLRIVYESISRRREGRGERR